MTRNCEGCGSTLIRQDEQGFYVCTECGLIYDEPVIQRNFGIISENKGNGQIENQSSPYIVGTQIGLKQERMNKYVKLQKLQTKSFIKPEFGAITVFNHLRAFFEVNLPIDTFIRAFKYLYPKMPAYSRGRNIQNLSSTIFIYVCRFNLVKLSLKTVIEHQNLSLKQYFEICNLISPHKRKLFSTTINNLQDTVRQTICRVAQDLELGEAITSRAFKIAVRFEKELGFKSDIIAGTSIALAIKSLNLSKEIRTYKIATELKVSASTLYLRIKRISMDDLTHFLGKIQPITSEPTVCDGITQPQSLENSLEIEKPIEFNPILIKIKVKRTRIFRTPLNLKIDISQPQIAKIHQQLKLNAKYQEKFEKITIHSHKSHLSINMNQKTLQKVQIDKDIQMNLATQDYSPP